MTRSEALAKVEALEAQHPWVGDYEWTVREEGDGEWIVVKVPGACQQQAPDRPSYWDEAQSFRRSA